MLLTAANAHGTDVPCAYVGADQEHPFRNGYEMSKFMISVVAAWSCISDTIIEVASSPAVPHAGEIIATDNEFGSETYDPEDPTHYRVLKESDDLTSVKLYYGFSVATPPTSNSQAGVYLAWNGHRHDAVAGRLVLDSDGLVAVHKAEDPIRMRMDFDHNSAQKQATMYLQFDTDNPFAEGFRIEVSKDLTVSPVQHVYTARGLVAMKAQFSPAPGVTETPNLRMYTVSDRFGEGAAIALMEDVALPMEIVAVTETDAGNHLGNYLFSKTDQYFFDADQSGVQPWDYIHKEITTAVYRGGRTTAETGGSWMPFNPSLDLIRSALLLSDTYFNQAECGVVDSSCVEFLNAVFNSSDGFDNEEKNQGSLPTDWRAVAIANATYLDQVYPAGSSDWSLAFVMSFN